MHACTPTEAVPEQGLDGGRVRETGRATPRAVHAPETGVSFALACGEVTPFADGDFPCRNFARSGGLLHTDDISSEIRDGMVRRHFWKKQNNPKSMLGEKAPFIGNRPPPP